MQQSVDFGLSTLRRNCVRNRTRYWGRESVFPFVLSNLIALLVVGSSAVSFGLSPNVALAQEDADISTTVRITLDDGTEYIGRVVSESDDELVLETTSGVRVTIPKTRIDSIAPIVDDMHRGKVMRKDPNRTRLLFSPTARPLKSGEGYVALYEVFFPFVAVGVADIATLAGGLSLLPGVSEQLVYVAPKVTFVNSGKTSLAIGGFAATLTGTSGTGGIVYGVATHGTSYAAVTGGVGFLFGGGEFVETPIFLLGGEYQLSDNVKLLSENYVIPEVESGFVLSGGIRFIGESVSGDFGLFTSPEAFDEGGFPFLPWLGFSYQFGK